MSFLELYRSAMMASNDSTLSNTTYAPYGEWSKSAVNRSLIGIMCVLSTFGSLTIMSSYAFWQDVRTTSRKILLYLSVSDLLIAISNLFGVLIPMDDNLKDPRNSQCKAQSFITTSASITSFLWTLSLAIYLYLAIVKNKQDLGRKLLPWFHVINWSLGPIINGVALYEGMLGYAADPITGGWCWIYHDTSKDTKDKFVLPTREKVWILIDGKGIEILVYTTIFVIYGIIKWKLWKELNQRLQGPMEPDVLKSAKSADRKLIFVPLLLFFGRFFGILKFFLVMFSDQKRVPMLKWTEKALLTLEGVGDSSQGFLNCILFCFLNPRVYSHIKEACLGFFCPQRRGADHLSHPEHDRGSLNGDGHSSMSFPQPSGEERQPLLDGVTRIDKYGSKWTKS